VVTSSQQFSQQYSLDIAPRTFATFETFVSDQDYNLLNMLKELRVHSNEPRQYYIWGAKQTGKSHLLHSVCNYLVGTEQRTIYLPLEELSSSNANIFQNIHNLDIVCIDDIDKVLGDNNWESALFQLINELRAKNKNLVMTASNNPNCMNVSMPDLKSRLVWGPVYKLSALDDEQKTVALQRHAKARGFEISLDVCNYLMKRYTRELTQLVTLLDQIDHHSLVQQRKVTIPFVKTVLDDM